MKQKVLVVGAGLGGMSAAISLAAHPQFEVILIEKNLHLGGKLNVMTKNGFNFDLGPSILTMPFLFERLFKIHNRKMEDYFKIVPVRPHWRNFFEDGKILDLTADINQMTNNPEFSSHDLAELKEYLSYAKKVYDFTEKAFFNNQSERKLDTLKYYNPIKIIPDSDMLSTMDQGVKRYISNPKMRQILNFFIKYVGSSPFDAPAVLNLLPYIQWQFDLWYVEGGMFNLSVGLEKLIKELSIKVMTNTELISVKEINKKVVSATLSNNQTLEIDYLVSNMEVVPFHQRIGKIDDTKLSKIKSKYPPSCSGYALHLGLSKTYPQLAHHNVIHANQDKDHFDKIFKTKELSLDPTIYLVAPMKTDLSQGPKGGEIIKILPHIPHLENGKDFSKEDYAKYKEAILNKLERIGLKDIRKYIVTEELWTPTTIQKTYYSTEGSIYGVLSDKKINMGFKNPKKSPFYKNVYFVGGSTNPGGGMPMVVLSGQQVVEQILKEKSA